MEFYYHIPLSCGGWKIRTNNIDYLVNKVPSDFEERLRKTAFPVSVLLDYEVNSSICGVNKIYVDVGKIKIK